MTTADWHDSWHRKLNVTSDWCEDYKKKMTTPEEAVKSVKSGDRVVCPIGRDPLALGLALASRMGEIQGLRVFLGSPTYDFGWYDAGWEESFRLCLGYTFPRGVASACLAEKRADVYIGSLTIFDELADFWDVDAVIVEVTPPDENGFCAFGASVYDKRHWVAKAKLVLAEVNSQLIRTYGDNQVHVSQIDRFVEHPHTGRKPGEVSLSGKKIAETTTEQKQITEFVSSLINDGDTIQIGQGGTSEALVRCGLLDGKSDIGWHSEVTPGGIIKLVKQGIINGKYKNLDRGKAVATAIGGGTIADMNFVNLNPMFELRDVSYTHDPRTISSFDNIVTINNALEVDLTGQVNSEARGPRMFSGPGGLLAFVIGSRLAKNGRSVVVLPATAQNDTVSRVVPMLNSKVTVPHNLTDYIVTEYGVARMRGKTIRERTEALIEIAHPDLRSDLRKAAKELYWP